MTSSSELRHPIADADKAAFAEDGAICLRQQFDSDWVARLQRAADEIISERRGGTQEFTARDRPGRYVSNLFMWREHPVFSDFIHNSPAPAIAGEILGATKINHLFDHLLVKEPGTKDPTKWHHDLTFWPVDGSQICSIWLALDPVTQESGGVEYVAGSHKWPDRYRPVQPHSPELARKKNMDLPDCPSFHDKRDQYRMLSWDLEPGDCLVFHSLVIHGSGGNASSDTRRRGFATRWCGDDVSYIDADFVLELPEAPGLPTGAPLDSDLFPVVWRRAG